MLSNLINEYGYKAISLVLIINIISFVWVLRLKSIKEKFEKNFKFFFILSEVSLFIFVPIEMAISTTLIINSLFIINDYLIKIDKRNEENLDGVINCECSKCGYSMIVLEYCYINPPKCPNCKIGLNVLETMEKKKINNKNPIKLLTIDHGNNIITY